MDLAAQVALRAVKAFFQENGVDQPKTVRWVMFDESAYQAWKLASRSGDEL